MVGTRSENKEKYNFFISVFIYLPFIIVQLIVFATSLFYSNQGLILCSQMGPSSPKAHYLPRQVDFLQKQKLKFCSWEET